MSSSDRRSRNDYQSRRSERCISNPLTADSRPQLGHDLFGHLVIAIHVLHVIVIFEHFDQPEDFAARLGIDGHAAGGDLGDFTRDLADLVGFERLPDRLKRRNITGDFELVAVLSNVVQLKE